MSFPPEKILTHKWLDPKCCDTGCQSLFLKHAREEIEELKTKLAEKDALFNKSLSHTLTHVAEMNQIKVRGLVEAASRVWRECADCPDSFSSEGALINLKNALKDFN